MMEFQDQDSSVIKAYLPDSSTMLEFHPAPDEPTPETQRRWDEFERQLEIYHAKKEELLQKYGGNRWCVLCKDELIGVYDSYEEAQRAGDMTAAARGTDVSLVGELRDKNTMPELDIGGFLA